jgi:hypothetical protein
MKPTHPFALIPYHNPENATTPIPRGWRLRYQHEVGTSMTRACIWMYHCWSTPLNRSHGICEYPTWTYIVPIDG